MHVEIRSSYDVFQCILYPDLTPKVFSVDSATLSRNTVNLFPESAEFTATNGNIFNIVKIVKSYYLNKISAMHSKSLEEWHKILGK